MLKNWKSIFLALSLIPCMAACTAKTGEEDKAEENIPKLTWIVPGSEQRDMASVTEAINEITVPRIGAKVDIQFVNETLYADRMVMNIAMGSDFDLCFSGYLNSYVDSVQNGGYLDITDYLAESEKLKSIFPDYALEGLKMEGRIYAIPNMQILTSSTGLFIQKDLAEEYGLKREDIHYLEDIEPMLEWVKQNKPDIYPFKTGRYGGGLKNENLNQYSYSSEGIVAAYDSQGNISFMPEFDSDDWSEGPKLLHRWYEKGYVRPDIADINDDENEIYEKKYAVWRGAYKPGGEEEFNANYNFECIAIQLTPERLTNGAPSACTAIGKNSKYPELAFKLLEEVNTDPELFNLIAFGIEGKHYTKNADGKLHLKKDGGYLARGAWKFGNAFNSYILEGQDKDVWSKTEQFNDNAKKMPINGWNFDRKSVRNEINAITLIKKKYSVLSNGSEPFDNYIDGYIRELTEAGIYKVSEEAARQYEQWKKNNER